MDDLGLTGDDWHALRTGYVYGTAEPTEGSVQEQAFLYLAAWDREATGRKARREQLSAAMDHCARQPFPGEPLTARLGSGEAAELAGKLRRGFRAAETAARGAGYQAPENVSLSNAAAEIRDAHRDVHAEAVIREDAHARAHGRNAFPGGMLTTRLTSREAAELSRRLFRGKEAAWRVADEAGRWQYQNPQGQTAFEIEEAYQVVEAEMISSGLRWPGESIEAFSRRAAREPEPGPCGAPGAEALADFEAEP